ncbi:hypothetical protein ACOQFV_13115 [Nocardiopsis changdeensis]|nr:MULTISPECIES: hypothetical protein [Nocardiopsis]
MTAAHRGLIAREHPESPDADRPAGIRAGRPVAERAGGIVAAAE